MYTGLGLVSVGLIITFLGLGSRGFRTLEVKLLGPGLVGVGMMCVLIRIIFCYRGKQEKQVFNIEENMNFKILTRSEHSPKFDSLDRKEEKKEFPSGQILLNHSRMYVDTI